MDTSNQDKLALFLKKGAIFFAWIGGSVRSIIRECSHSVIAARGAIGGLMFIVTLVSAIVAGFLWSNIFGPFAGIVSGLVWFVLILTLDRVLLKMTDGKKDSNLLSKVGIFAMRFILVVLTSLMSATFLQMEIFKTEIDRVVRADRQEKTEAIENKYATAQKAFASWSNDSQKDFSSWEKSSQASLDAREKVLRDREAAIVGEIEGTSGSGKKGEGPAAKAKREALDREKIEFADAKQKFAAELAEAKKKLGDSKTSSPEVSQLAQAKKVYDEDKKTLLETPDNGLLVKYRALDELRSENPFVWAVAVLILLIEMLAFIVKMMYGSDEYDERLAEQRAAGSFAVEKLAHARKAKMRKEFGDVVSTVPSLENSIASIDKLGDEVALLDVALDKLNTGLDSVQGKVGEDLSGEVGNLRNAAMSAAIVSIRKA